MATKKQLVDSIKKPLAKKKAEEEDKLFGKTRAKLASRPHFVPIQLGAMNVMELTLKNYIQFADKNQIDSFREEYKQKMIAAYERETSQVTRAEKGKSVIAQISDIYDRTIGTILGLTVFNFDQLKEALIAFIKNKFSNRLILTKDGWYNDSVKLDINQFNQLLTTGPALVYFNSVNDINIIGVVFGSYSSAGTNLFTPFFNKMLSGATKFAINTPFGQTTTEIPPLLQLSTDYIKKLSEKQEKAAQEIKITLGVDIGHLAGTTEAVTTVLQQKIRDITDWVNDNKDMLTQRGDFSKYLAALQNANQKLLQDLGSDSPDKTTYGQLIEDQLIELEIFTKLTEFNIIVVIPQEQNENRYLAGTLVEKVIAQNLATIIPEYKESPSLIDRITQILVETIKYSTPKLTRYNKASKITFTLSGSKKQLPKINFIVGGGKSQTISAGKLNKPKKQKPIGGGSPVISDSSVSLQKLLDSMLTQTIKNNMGTGTSRDILNLRSGRFADSVRVERISENRQGMITAFYSYMRNPYATFSSGGKQQYPRTRDPKLLISKSIRQLAQQLQITRLKAVLV